MMKKNRWRQVAHKRPMDNERRERGCQRGTWGCHIDGDAVRMSLVWFLCRALNFCKMPQTDNCSIQECFVLVSFCIVSSRTVVLLLVSSCASYQLLPAAFTRLTCFVLSLTLSHSRYLQAQARL